MTNDCPEIIEELAQACQGYVERAVGVCLDFTPETLPLLEHYLESVRPSLAERESLLPLMARVVGAYFGELVRRRYGGFWRVPSDNVQDWQLCLSPVFLWINPVGAAYDALVQGEEHDGPRSMLHVALADRELVRERLAIVPAVPEDEFYSLTTRLESLEVATEVLHQKLAQEGESEMAYTEEDYAADPRLN